MDSITASNLTTTDIIIPVKAKGGQLGVEGMKAKLYKGALDTTAKLDVTGDTPAYSLGLLLAGIQADPLLDRPDAGQVVPVGHGRSEG